MMRRGLLIALAIMLAAPLVSQGQNASAQDRTNIPQLDEIAISPSRLAIPLAPGTEKTVVVNLIYTTVTGSAPPTRIVAYLGDWDISKEGKIGFYKPGTKADSASSWLIYSPVETTVLPGKTHPIRVTISVPQDATPGDHLAALFVEPRLDNIKLQKNTKQVQMKFRLAALFYIMVPGLKRNASLEDLKAAANEQAIVVTPKLKNTGNTHVRPVYSVKVADSAGMVVAEIEEAESLPVLGASELEAPIVFHKVLSEGTYSVQYRVDFGNGTVTEGQTAFVVREDLKRPAVAPVSAGTGVKSGNR